jgi:hypothetical protein
LTPTAAATGTPYDMNWIARTRICLAPSSAADDADVAAVEQFDFAFEPPGFGLAVFTPSWLVWFRRHAHAQHKRCIFATLARGDAIDCSTASWGSIQPTTGVAPGRRSARVEIGRGP